MAHGYQCPRECWRCTALCWRCCSATAGPSKAPGARTPTPLLATSGCAAAQAFLALLCCPVLTRRGWSVPNQAGLRLAELDAARRLADKLGAVGMAAWYQPARAAASHAGCPAAPPCLRARRATNCGSGCHHAVEDAGSRAAQNQMPGVSIGTKQLTADLSLHLAVYAE